MKFRILMALLLTSASYASLAQTTNPSVAQNAPTLDETAHFLAGMPVTGVLEPLTHDPAWQEHAQAMNEGGPEKNINKFGRFANGCRRLGLSITAATTPFSTCLAGRIFCTPAFFFRSQATTFSPGSNRSATSPISPMSHSKCCTPI